MERKTKERIFTKLEMVKMELNEFQCFEICLNARAFRLIGIHWKEWVTVEQDINNNIIFRYR